MSAETDSSIGFTVVVLPGMDGTGKLLADFTARLSIHYRVRVIAYPNDQLLGYDDLVAYVRKQLPDKRFAIVAESFSGPIAIELAATDQRVAGLVLASSFARHPLPSLLAGGARFVNVNWLPNLFSVAGLLGSSGSTELRSRLANVLSSLPHDIVQTRLAAALRVDKRRQLAEILCPIMCLHGRADRLVGKKQIQMIKALQPSCRIVWFNAPHMLLETSVDEATHVVDQFCRALA